MHGLGGLEAEVMNELWSTDEPQSVHDLVDRLRDRKEFAYTTILTVVTHLYEKGWVQREKRSRAYFYSPSRSREEATSQALRALLSSSADPSEGSHRVPSTREPSAGRARGGVLP